MRGADRTADQTLAVFCVTGPPGAGKTTALLWLASGDTRLARFGVRDYGLRLAAAGDPLGLRLRDPLTRQELLTDDQVREEFEHFLDNLPGTARSLAVEGYPRDLRQCGDVVDAVKRHGAWFAGCVVVDVPDALVRARVVHRRVCQRCGRPTSAAAGPACGDCGGPVAPRGDDAAARLDRRLADYRAVSPEVREYFADRGLLRVIDGTRRPDEVRADLAMVLLGREGVR